MYVNLTWTRLGIQSHCLFDGVIGKWKNVHSSYIHLWERQPRIPCEKENKSVFAVENPFSPNYY